MRLKSIFLLLLLVLSVALACNLPGRRELITSTPEPSLTETPTPQPLPTIAPTPTVTPTPLPVVRIHAGDQALLEGRWDTAIEEFQTANNTSPDSEVDSAALLGTGRTQLLSGNPLEAARIFQKLIDEYPQSSQLSTAYFLMAQAYSDLDRYAEAAQAYSSYAALRPGLIDGYVQDLRGDALFAAADYASAIPAYQAAIQSPGLIDTIGIEMKMARAVALSGDYIKALELYEDILARSSDDSTKALIDLRKGQIYTALGETDLATSVYLDAVNNYPTSYDSYSALLALVEAGIPVNELNRGLVDYYAGQYGVAIAAFDRYLQSSPDDPGTARYYMGLAMRDSGSYESAINEWDKIIQQNPDHRFWDEAWEQKAYTQWFYLDQYTQAIQTLLDFVNLAPTHPRTAEFLFDAAIVAERDDQLDQAAELWERVANLFPDYENSSRALFLSGISNYRLDDYNAASATFQRLLGIAVTPEDRARALLWLGKTQSKLGDLAGAHTYWGQAAEQDPTGYYSERARDLLFDRKPFWPPQSYNMAIDWEGEKHIAEDWLRQTFSLPSETVLDGLGSLASAQEMIRGAELWKLGLYSEARNEFEQLRKAVSSDPVQLYQLANYLAELGLYRSATLAARQVLDLAGLDDAGTLNAPVYFNRLRFGTYYSDLIVPAAQAAQFHPLFIFSLIRQESLFESFVRSSAAASGLMQIIPSTGADIASRLGWPANYTDKDLLRPVVNVTFGVDYLNRQRELFDGDIYAALAAYNGGPGNAMAWYEQAKGDPDLFLEIVRFSETRDYIRRIYEIFNLYRRIYSITP